MRLNVLLAIAGMALVTYVPRVLPMTALSRRPLPAWFRRWLTFVPIAVLSALLAPALLLPGGAWQPLSANLPLLAAIPTALVAYRTQGLFTTVLTGLASIAALEALQRFGFFITG